MVLIRDSVHPVGGFRQHGLMGYSQDGEPMVAAKDLEHFRYEAEMSLTHVIERLVNGEKLCQLEPFYHDYTQKESDYVHDAAAEAVHGLADEVTLTQE